MRGTFVRGMGLCHQTVNSISLSVWVFRSSCKSRIKISIKQIFLYISNSCPNFGISTSLKPFLFNKVDNFCWRSNSPCTKNNFFNEPF